MRARSVLGGASETAMLVAVISDIHSNVHALRAVLQDAERAGVERFWFGGDAFGYYPWAGDTFELLRLARPLAVRGNHDGWLIDRGQAPANIAGEIADRNRQELGERCPAALAWLATLPVIRHFRCAGWEITLAHGTPEDPVEGRYYPDDQEAYGWLPQAGEIMILGQTHYPIMRGDGDHGLMLNPGSVGQPRDGDPMPSWALLDLATGAAELRRTSYDNQRAMRLLRAQDWDEQVTLALGRVSA